MIKFKLVGPVILLVAIVGGVFAYFSYSSKPAAETSSPATTEKTVSTTTSNSDISRVTQIMKDMCQGYLTNNTSLIVSHVSKETAEFLSAGKMDQATECTVNKIYKNNENIVANVTLTVPQPGKPSSQSSVAQNMVFIKEGGDWKLDLAAIARFEIEQAAGTKIGQ